MSITELPSKAWIVTRSHSGEVIAAAIGAISGSFVAYALQRGNERRIETERRRGAIINAQVALISQLNTLRVLWEKHLKPHADDQNRTAKIGPIRFVLADQMVDIGSLNFLVCRDSPDAPLQVHLAQRSYLSAIDCLKNRNGLSDRLFHSGELVGFGEKIATLRNADPKVLAEFESETNQLFKSFPDAIERTEESIEMLRRIGSMRYSTWLRRRFGPTFLRVKKMSDINS